MSNNRTFFKNVREGQMSYKDIFSDVTKKHTPEQTARVFIAGTELTTPSEAEMLAGWQKPFLFARFFVLCVITLGLAYVLSYLSPGGNDTILVGMAMIVPMTMLLLAWEMNVPRTISLMEVLKIVAVGGVLSLIITLGLRLAGLDPADSALAPVVEEPAKLIVIILILKRKNYKYILEGVLLGMAVGTGFAIIETLNYILNSTRNGMVIGIAELMLNWINQGASATDAVNQLIDLINNQLSALSYTVYMYGYEWGLQTAVLRGFNGIVGHGVYAALYGGGLMIAKGAENFNFKHLANKDFLKFFAASFLIHFLNNSELTDGFPWLIENYVMSWSIVKTALGAFFLLPLLKKGVNQIVDVTTRYNGGRVTMAVNRAVSPVHEEAGVHVPTPAVSAALEFVAGPYTGQSFSMQEGQSLSIGRATGRNIIALPSCGSVSSTHCTVGFGGGQIVVTDLGSTNGTYIGGQRLAPNQSVRVPDGAVVYLGGQNCAFRIRVQ